MFFDPTFFPPPPPPPLHSFTLLFIYFVSFSMYPAATINVFCCSNSIFNNIFSR